MKARDLVVQPGYGPAGCRLKEGRNESVHRACDGVTTQGDSRPERTPKVLAVTLAHRDRMLGKEPLHGGALVGDGHNRSRCGLHQGLGGDREYRIRCTGRSPHLVKLEQVWIDNGPERYGMAQRRCATDCVPGGRPDLGGGGYAHLEAQVGREQFLVDTFGPGTQNQHGPDVCHEYQGLDDLADPTAHGRGRIGCCTRSVREPVYLDGQP